MKIWGVRSKSKVDIINEHTKPLDDFGTVTG
jgi:hypothetical protein